MDWGYVALVAVSFGFLLILGQRIVPRHRKAMRRFTIGLGILLMIRYDLQFENLVGYLFALIISFLFWLLIGRYNAVSDDSGIKVYRLND